jgi:type II secretory pathway component PulF
MASFRARVADSHGKIDSVVRAAPSAEVASRELAGEGVYVLSIDEVDPVSSNELTRFKATIVREFTDSLSTLLAAGLPLAHALEVQQTVFERGDGARLLSFLRARIERGDSLSCALSELNRSFSPVYRGLVRIGEQIGSLSGVMTRLSSYLRRRKQLRDKLLGSLTYPAVVLVVAAAGVVVIGTVVLPRVQAMFEELGSTVPEAAVGATRSLAGLAYGIGVPMVAILLAVVGVVVARNGPSALMVDHVLLRLPVVGAMIRRGEVLNFLFAMETLTESGVPVETALREASGVLDNRALAGATREIAARVTDGGPLSTGFADSGLFPQRLAVWARIGERTGDAGAVFGQLRGYYEEEMKRWIDRCMTLVEPTLIVAVGAIVLVLVITFIVPLFGAFGSLL